MLRATLRPSPCASWVCTLAPDPRSFPSSRQTHHSPSFGLIWTHSPPQKGEVEYDIEYHKVEKPDRRKTAHLQLPPLAIGSLVHVEVEERGLFEGKPFWRLAEVCAATDSSLSAPAPWQNVVAVTCCPERCAFPIGHPFRRPAAKLQPKSPNCPTGARGAG